MMKAKVFLSSLLSASMFASGVVVPINAMAEDVPLTVALTTGANRIYVKNPNGEAKLDYIGHETTIKYHGMMYVEATSVATALGGKAYTSQSDARIELNNHILTVDADNAFYDGKDIDVTEAFVFDDGLAYVRCDLIGQNGFGYAMTQNVDYNLVVYGNNKASKNYAMFFGTYISPNGDDSNPGTAAQPVKTLAGATRTYTTIYNACKSAGVEYNVYLKAGTYSAGTTATISMSGSENAPINIKPYGDGEVYIDNSIGIDSSRFSLSSNSAIPVNGAVYEANVGDLIADTVDYTTLTGDSNRNQGAAYTDYYMLCQNAEKQTIARFPNVNSTYPWMYVDTPSGTETDKTVHLYADATQFNTWQYDANGKKVTNSNLEKWSNSTFAWVSGYLGYYWAWFRTPISTISGDKINTALHPLYGIRKNAPFFIENLLEELDSPGEWYLDIPNKKLYYYPIDNSLDNITLCIEKANLATISASKYINIEDIYFQNSRNYVKIVNSSNVNIKNCVFRNIGSHGIYADNTNYSAVKNVVIDHCDFYNLGGSGVTFDETAGVTRDDCSLIPQSNVIKNCKIHNYNQVWRTVAGGIVVRGSGNTMSHNEIYDSPHSGIYHGGSSNVIEYNDIHDVLKESSDAGVIYTCVRDFTKWGTVINNNYIHNIPTTYLDPSGVDGTRFGIYIDDFSSGVTVKNNVVDTCWAGLLVGGGWGNDIEDNLFINMTNRGYVYDARGTSTRSYGAAFAIPSLSVPNGEAYSNTTRSLSLIDGVDKWAAYSAKYPILAKFRKKYDNWTLNQNNEDNDIGIPNYAILKNNKFYSCPSDKLTVWYAPNTINSAKRNQYVNVYSDFATDEGNVLSGTVVSLSAYGDYSQLIEGCGVEPMTVEHNQPIEISKWEVSDDLSKVNIEYAEHDGNDYDIYLTLYDNNEFLGANVLRGVSATDGKVIVDTDMNISTVTDNTVLNVFTWKHDTLMPLGFANVLTNKIATSISSITKTNGYITVYGHVYPAKAGKQVLLRLSNSENISSIDDVIAMEQLTTNELGAFTWVVEYTPSTTSYILTTCDDATAVKAFK